MIAGNQLEREIRELKLLVKGLSKVKDFPQELFELMDNHINTISLLIGGSSDNVGLDNHVVSLNDAKTVQSVLNDTIETKRVVDMNKMMTLNDRFRFQREFFGNDSSRMNECLSIINGKETKDEAVEYFKGAYPESEKSDAYDEFIEMLGKMFIKKRS